MIVVYCLGSYLAVVAAALWAWRRLHHIAAHGAGAIDSELTPYRHRRGAVHDHLGGNA